MATLRCPATGGVQLLSSGLQSQAEPCSVSAGAPAARVHNVRPDWAMLCAQHCYACSHPMSVPPSPLPTAHALCLAPHTIPLTQHCGQGPAPPPPLMPACTPPSGRPAHSLPRTVCLRFVLSLFSFHPPTVSIIASTAFVSSLPRPRQPLAAAPTHAPPLSSIARHRAAAQRRTDLRFSPRYRFSLPLPMATCRVGGTGWVVSR